MSKTYVKILQEDIENLQDGFDMQGVEIILLQNDIEETLSPYKLLGEQSGYLIEMLTEVIEFEKNKPSDRVKASKKRLLALMDTNTELGKIVGYNQKLKLYNQQLLGHMQLLRLKNKELRDEILKFNQINNF